MYLTDREQVDVSCSYLEASQDRGYLVIVFSKGNHYPAYCAARRDKFENTTSVSIPGEGLENPMVVVYDLNNPSGLPERTSAVKPRPAHAMATTSFGSAIHNGECINTLTKLQIEACQPEQKLTDVRVHQWLLIRPASLYYIHSLYSHYTKKNLVHVAI